MSTRTLKYGRQQVQDDEDGAYNSYGAAGGSSYSYSYQDDESEEEYDEDNENESDESTESDSQDDTKVVK